MNKTLAKNLSQTTKRLETTYRKWKDGEVGKKSNHQKFFELADKALQQEEVLALKTVTIPDEYKDDPYMYVERHYPEWATLSETLFETDLETRVVLKERPEYKPFFYVNHELGLVFQRSITKGEPIVDDEALQQEDPDLYKEVVEMVPMLKPLDEMTDKQRAGVQKYTYRKPPKQRLEPPRRAKPEELA